MKTHIRNFSLLNIAAIAVAPGLVTARFELPSPPPKDIMLYNSGLNAVYVRTGDSGVVGDANAMPIAPGEKGVYQIGDSSPPATHLAYITLVGVSVMTIVPGEGS